jgi:DNA anti-recombination protein RmuC
VGSCVSFFLSGCFLSDRFLTVESRLGEVEKRLDKVEERLDRVEERLDKVEERLEKVEKDLEKNVGEINDRLDKLTEQNNTILKILRTNFPETVGLDEKEKETSLKQKIPDNFSKETSPKKVASPVKSGSPNPNIIRAKEISPGKEKSL